MIDGWLEGIYKHMPVLLQHAAISVRGSQLRKLRYTQHTEETLDFIMISQHWSSGRFREYQEEKLQGLVNHCFEHVPFYRYMLAEHHLRPSDIRRLDDLQKLPILTKEMFRRNSDRLVATNYDRRRMWVSYTSGTTGTPLAAYFTRRTVQERIAFLRRLYRWYSPKHWPRRASFTGQLIVDPDSHQGPFHRLNLPIHQQLYSSHHLLSENLDQYINELSHFAPDQIDGIASSMYIIADYMIRHHRVGAVSPRVVIPTSETIWPHVRERLEAGYQCKVANQYGSQEGAPLAYECPEGGFHICPESGIFEILKPDGAPARPGELGVLVVTSFLSEGMPLLRYNIGDLASWSTGKCSCGRQMPLLRDVVGRIDDLFYTRERGVVPRIDSAFKGLPTSIIGAQVAQVGPDTFEVRIIPDPDLYRGEHGDLLAANLREYLGHSVYIHVKLVQNIPRTAGGKLQAMVNEWKYGEEPKALIGEWNLGNRL